MSALEILEKHWLKIPLILYSVGFVVHNVYLANFGSYEFQLVQAKYILSGFGLIGFSIICFVYTGIKVNLTNINKSFTIDKLLPWTLRVFSLPYFLYTILYGKELFTLIEKPINEFTVIVFLASTIAHTVVSFSIFNIAFMVGDAETKVSKLAGILSRIFSVPMVLVTVVIAWNIPEFSGILKTTIFFFFGYWGIAMRQGDKILGIEPKYSDPETNEEHENLYQIIFGVIAIFILFWLVISNYTSYIYPKIPVALGGARTEQVTITVKNKDFDSLLIQETAEWLTYINSETGQVEKIKASSVEKIIYKEKFPNKANSHGQI